MKTTYFASILLLVVGNVLAYDVIVPADMACRTRSDDTTYGSTVVPVGDGNNHDSSKLTIRNGDRGEKSWIRFDELASYDLTGLRGATLSLTFIEAENAGYVVSLSALNDDCHDNDIWVDHPVNEVPAQGIFALTWNNAPGNNPADYSNLNAEKTSLVVRHTFPAAAAIGDVWTLDVLSVLQGDTDGIIQLILHNAQNSNFATWDHATVAYRPYLTLTYPPLGADYPTPAVGQTVSPSLASLSWQNPEPNNVGDPIWCEVYLGTEPNRLDTVHMKKVTLGNNVETVAISAFPGFAGLQNNTTYYWFVDCHDPVKGLVAGEQWSFYVGTAPNVSAGPDQVLWLTTNPLTVNLNGTTSDDGTYTVQWTQVANGAPAVTISPNNVDDTSVSITARGNYVFELKADDGSLQTSDTVRIVVGNDACDASHLDSGAAYNVADNNEDCLVDLTDFIAVIAEDWLHCTDTLTNCAN